MGHSQSKSHHFTQVIDSSLTESSRNENLECIADVNQDGIKVYIKNDFIKQTSNCLYQKCQNFATHYLSQINWFDIEYVKFEGITITVNLIRARHYVRLTFCDSLVREKFCQKLQQSGKLIILTEHDRKCFMNDRILVRGFQNFSELDQSFRLLSQIVPTYAINMNCVDQNSNLAMSVKYLVARKIIVEQVRLAEVNVAKIRSFMQEQKVEITDTSLIQDVHKEFKRMLYEKDLKVSNDGTVLEKQELSLFVMRPRI